MAEGQYHIVDVDKRRTLIKKEHWTRSINLGAHLTMSMIMSRIGRTKGQCPRLSCAGTGFVQCHVTTLLTWSALFVTSMLAVTD